MRKLLSLFLALLLSFMLVSCGELGGTDQPSGGQNIQSDVESEPSGSDAVLPDENGSYTSKEDVALYLWVYGHFPDNFITKADAQDLGWSGGSLEPYAPGGCIGGGRIGNFEGLLPEVKGETYSECDIDTMGADSRGAKRIVFSSDGHIYYTDDHYGSFTEIRFTEDYQMAEETVE